MVAERRERKAAPTSWVQPEPAGKGKAVRKKAPAKKKQPAKSVSAAAAAAAPAPASHAAAVQQDHRPQEQGGGDMQQDLGPGYTPGAGTAQSTSKGGAGPVETETGEQLFCICLGVDNGTPMIFCEACENWFHFECINLSEEDASRIATYYCDMCEQAGSGKTEWSYEAPSTFDELPSFPTEGPPDSPAHQATPLSAPSISTLHPLPLPPPPPVMTPSDSGEDHDNAEDDDYFTSRNAEASTAGKVSSQKASQSPALANSDEEDEEDDDDYDEQTTSASSKRRKGSTSRLPALPKGNQRRKSSSAGISNAKRRKRVVEDEDEAEERRRKSASTSHFYGNGARPAPNPSDPLSNPTRKHCIEQLEKILSAIFTAALPSTSTVDNVPRSVSPEKAREYAEAIELELFTHNSEPDPKGVLILSKRYTAKFRTLHFNLKSNEYFRSRVASGILDAKTIYNMNQEDLLSPEVRAEQEAEKAKLLAQSVKIDIERPKTKMTHKGEEILDEFDSTGDNNNPASDYRGGDNGSFAGQERRDSMNIITGDTPYLPNEGFDWVSERERSMSLAGSPRLGDSPRFASPSAVFADSPTGRAYSPIVESPREQILAASPNNTASMGAQETLSENQKKQDEFARPALPHHARSDSLSKAKLDLDAVWSNLKPAPASASPEKEDVERESSELNTTKEKEEDDMDVESDNGDSSGNKKQDENEKEEYDPFSTDAREKSNADEDFDALMGSSEPSQESTKRESKQGPEEAPLSPSTGADEIASLPSVWEGTVSLVDEGSFPARLVQVGGTPFAPHPSIWERVLPKSKIEITGRIDEKAASEYVVQSNFSQSRENIVLAILPDLEKAPTDSETSTEKTEAMYSRLIAMYSDRKRYGVAPPSSELKKVTRDHYIVPLRKDAALPDYVELLDSHTIPEKGYRKRDYLLSVLVLQKGLGLNTTHRSTASGGSTPQPSQDRAAGIANAQHRGQLHPSIQQGGSSHMSPPVQSGIQPQAPAFPSHMSPPYQPPMVPSQAQASNPPAMGAALPSLDPAALQSLLSNPSLLQALSAGGQQGSPPHSGGAQYGAFSPPRPSANNSGYSASGIPGISAGVPPMPSAPPVAQTWGAPPLSQQPGYPPFPPAPAQGHWNPAGSPPWQGGQQMPLAGGQPPWNGGPQQNHPPGYIDPERIKAASAEARMIAERDRREKSRFGGSGGGGDTSRRGGGRDRNERRGGRDRGFGDDDRRGGGRGDRNGGRKHDSGSGGINQMQAGIQDRGWGRRG